jgi:hypothetical protein
LRRVTRWTTDRALRRGGGGARLIGPAYPGCAADAIDDIDPETMNTFQFVARSTLSVGLAISHLRAISLDGDLYLRFYMTAWMPPTKAAEDRFHGLVHSLNDEKVVQYMDFAFTNAVLLTFLTSGLLLATLGLRRLWLALIYGLLDTAMNVGIAVVMTARNQWHKQYLQLIIGHLWLPVWSCRVLLLLIAARMLFVAVTTPPPAKDKDR